MKPKMLSETRIYFVQTCVDCGKEFRIAKNSKAIRCLSCRKKLSDAKMKELYQAKEERLKNEIQFFIGAVILKVEHTEYAGELSGITVKTLSGKTIELNANGGTEDYAHIEWEEKEMA